MINYDMKICVFVVVNRKEREGGRRGGGRFRFVVKEKQTECGS